MYIYACIYICIYMHVYIYIYYRHVMPFTALSASSTILAYGPNVDVGIGYSNLAVDRSLCTRGEREREYSRGPRGTPARDVVRPPAPAPGRIAQGGLPECSDGTPSRYSEYSEGPSARTRRSFRPPAPRAVFACAGDRRAARARGGRCGRPRPAAAVRPLLTL